MATNLLGSDPPFLNNPLERIGYDQENGDLTGRSVTLGISQRI